MWAVYEGNCISACICVVLLRICQRGMRQALISIVHIIVIWNKSPKFRQLVTELYIEFDIDMVIRDVKSLKDKVKSRTFQPLTP